MQFLLLICVCVLTAVSGQCTIPSTTVPLPANLPGSTLNFRLSTPSNVKVQTIAGAAWSIAINQNHDKLALTLGYDSVSGLFTGVATMDTDSGVSLSSSSSPLITCLSLVSCLLFMKLNTDFRLILLIIGLSFIPFVVSDSVDCVNGTIVIHYPAGGNVVVNGIPARTCSVVPGGSSPVSTPVFLGVQKYLGTFWFNDPIVVDLDRDVNCTTNCTEIIVCGDEGCGVYKYWSDQFHHICPASGCNNDPLKSVYGRVYAPAVLADLDGNGKYDFCAGASSKVYCFEWDSQGHAFVKRTGFPVTANSEIRGMAAGDVDQDGLIEVFVTTTNSAIQVWAFKPNGKPLAGWPRYNTKSGPLEDGNPSLGSNAPAARNGMGHERYGAYGLNIAIGNIDHDNYLEIITTYDDHQIQAFKYNGIAYNTANVYKNHWSKYLNQPVTWGQATQRWTNFTTDEAWWLNGENGCGVNDKPSPYPADDPNGDGATPCAPGGDEWLQFTQVPPSIMDIDGDGENEILTLPNSEKGGSVEGDSYVTQNRVLFVLMGAYDSGGDPTATNMTKSGRRHPNFADEWPPAGNTVTCKDCFYNNVDPSGNCSSATICSCRQCYEGYLYPPEAVPSIAFADLQGDSNPEFVFGFDDGTVVAYGSSGAQLWSFSFAADLGINPQATDIECSEPTIADLNGDAVPEILFTTYGNPADPISSTNVMNLYILDSTGTKVSSVSLSTAETVENDYEYIYNGNGNGAAGAPTIADIDDDGQLEILINLFDSRLLVFTVPNSASNCLVWPTARGGYLRKGQPDVYP